MNNDLLKIKSKSKSRFNISTVSKEQMLKDIEQQNEQNIRDIIQQTKAEIEQNKIFEKTTGEQKKSNCLNLDHFVLNDNENKG